MDMNFVIAALLAGFFLYICIKGLQIMFGEMGVKSKNPRKMKPGLYSNRKGKYYHMNRDGSVNVGRLMETDEFKRQIEAAGRLYKRQVIMALYEGGRPPHQVGDLLPMNLWRLEKEWNDEWQEELDRLSEYTDINYNKLFGIEEEPELLTAEEIASQYVEEENDKEERTSKSTIRRYVSSGGSLRL